jgi:FkbM family methyltransferase
MRLLARLRLLVNRAGYDVTRENFKHRFVFALRERAITTVLDIGANTGQFAQALRRARYDGAIVSVEPLSAAFDELRRHAARDRYWTAQRAAVSAEPGILTMNVAANSVSSSALPILDRHTAAAPASRYVTTENVAATTVDALVDEHGLVPETTLLKIDVQGYEQSVLDGAVATLPRFGAVRTELSLVPLYAGQALLPELVQRLGQHGLELWFVEPGFTDPVTRRLLQLDGVFFRRSDF